MAVVYLQPGVGLTLVDASGSTARVELCIRAATSADSARSAVAALRELLPSSCVAVAARVTYTADEQDPAPGGGDADRAGVFVFETTTPGQLAVITIPGLRLDLVDVTAPYLVDMTKPAVIALIDGLISGLWCNPFGYTLETCITALVETLP